MKRAPTPPPPILQLKGQFLIPGNLFIIDGNHIIKTSIESQWFSLEIPLFRILRCCGNVQELFGVIGRYIRLSAHGCPKKI